MSGAIAMDPAGIVSLGAAGLKVTRMGLGTAPLGGLYDAVEDAEAHAVVRQAYDLGLRLFDTAPLYGYGQAERRVGHTLAGLPRDSFVVTTKVGRLLRADAPPDPTQEYDGVPFYKGAPPLNPVFDYSYDGALRSLTESLDRLGLDRVDAVYIHDPAERHDEALRGAYRALDRLRDEGVIRAVGVGMNRWEPLARFAREARFDLFLVAGRYTLLDQSALNELLPLCVERGIAVVIGGVYNSGILTDPRPGATFDYAPAAHRWVDRALRLRAVCERHGVPLKAAALQFPLAHPAVVTVLSGARSVVELTENVRLLRHPIPPDLWRDLHDEGLLPTAAPVPVS